MRYCFVWNIDLCISIHKQTTSLNKLIKYQLRGQYCFSCTMMYCEREFYVLYFSSKGHFIWVGIVNVLDHPLTRRFTFIC